MATSKEYLNYILERLSNIKGINYRAMMGEYIIYYQDKIIGGIYDNRFLVKPTKIALMMLPKIKKELPYKNGKEMLLLNDDFSKEFLKELFDKMFEELPDKIKKYK